MAMRSPITTERQNIQLLRESGFTQQQAEAVATVVENAVQSGFEKFSEVLSRELGAIRSELKAEIAAVRSELKAEIAALRSEVKAEISAVRSELRIEIRDSRIDIQKSINEQIWKILAIVIGVATISLAVMKLVPGWPG